jgi:hypothetical protein
MTSRPAHRVNLVNTRIGLQENVDNLGRAVCTKRQRLVPTIQTRVGVNQRREINEATIEESPSSVALANSSTERVSWRTFQLTFCQQNV